MRLIIIKKGLTEIVFILDRSGSMHGLEADTIGGFNSMMEKQKKDSGDDGEAYVSTVLFDDFSRVLHDRIPIENVPEMTDNDYYVGGCTALLDALGGAIHHIGNIHKYARKEDVPEKTLFVIITDGMENASRNYSYEMIQKMVKRQQKKYGWEFIFIGANIDAVMEAGRFGTENVYGAVGNAVHAMRSSEPMAGAAALDDREWSTKLDEDYIKRGR